MKEELTVLNSAVKPDAKVEMSGYEFSLLSTVLDEMFQQNVKSVYPFRFTFIDKDEEPVENPTEEQLKSGEVRQVLDVPATTAGSNKMEAYVGEMPYMVLEAKRNSLEIHHREIEKGNAVSFEELQKSKLTLEDEK